MVVVRGLEKSYNGVKALAGTSFSVSAGTITALVGANGAGKTTTLKILLGFLKPDAGKIELNYSQPGFIPEHPVFPYWLSSRLILDLTARKYGVCPSDYRTLLENYASKLNFELGLLQRRPATFSAGTVKKLAIIQNLIIRPDFLVADEPFSALDPPSIVALRRIFIELREAGRTIFVSSHLLAEIEKIADKIIVIKKGNIAAEFGLGNRPDLNLEQEFLNLTED